MSHYWWIECKKCGDDSPVGTHIYQNSQAMDFLCKNPSIIRFLNDLQYVAQDMNMCADLQIDTFISVGPPDTPYSECEHEWHPRSEYGEHGIADLESYEGSRIKMEVKKDE